MEVTSRSWLDIVHNPDVAQIDPGELLAWIEELASGSALDTVVVWSANLPGFAARLAGPAAGSLNILDSAEIGMRSALGCLNQRHA